MYKCQCYPLLVVCLLLSNPVYSSNIEFIHNSNFQLGIVGLDIQRYPRYNKYPLSGKPVVINNGIDKCLYLPTVKKGGYRLIYEPVKLISGRRYWFHAHLKSIGKTYITVEIRSGRKKVKVKNWVINDKESSLDFSFNADDDSKDIDVHALKIWVQPKKSVCIDIVSLRGPSNSSEFIAVANLTPNLALGVYNINELGYMTVSSILKDDIEYQIIDPVNKKIITKELLRYPSLNGKKINLFTHKRGFYRIDLIDHRTNKIISQRSYVVINKSQKMHKAEKRFGITMEEGPAIRTVIQASIVPEELYKLISQMGVGSIRIFSLASPSSLSNDGVNYDFFQLNSALNLAKKYNMDVLLELGSNSIDRIPVWLRNSDSNLGTIDLLNGLHYQYQKDALLKLENKYHYLSLKKYKKYLIHVFNDVKGKVDYYEIWNEPGYKFKPKDYLKISRLTSNVKDLLDPTAKLLGPTSTTVDESGSGENINHLPNFITDTLRIGLNKYIDYLSYHSRHAFLFLGKKFDRRNQETGFVNRIKLAEKDTNTKINTIWDTERGVPWKSYHSKRVDIWYGKKSPYAWIHSYNYLEPARRLPMIFVASMHQDVKRIFWFNVDSGVNTIDHSRVRWDLFDANMEPMPQIPAYNAMTEILFNSNFTRLIENKTGMRAYLFKNTNSTIIVIFNWKENNESISLRTNKHKFRLLDIMGNPINMSNTLSKYQKININGWPQYIVINNISPADVDIL